MNLAKRKLVISISGGRTSAVMTKRVIENLSDKFEIILVFANTGLEHEATLKFLNDIQNHCGVKITWVEALVDPRQGKGVRHTIVDFETASRNGEPFREVVKKYGIFNSVNMACTQRTKIDPINSYLKSIGMKFGRKLDHLTAIGYRADEADRISSRADDLGYIYPLVRWGVTKRDVAIECKKWSFDLDIPGDHFGNCQGCWKKSFRKLYTLAKEDPTVFDFFEEMEKKYGSRWPERKNVNPEDGRAYWYRNHTSVSQIKEEAAKGDFKPYSDDPYLHAYDFDPELDLGGSCGESCEIDGAHMIEQEFPFMEDFRYHNMDMSY